MTFLVPLSFCVSTFFIRWSSTKGPFFRLRGIFYVSLAPLRGFAATHDHAVALLVRAAGAALWLAPRADRVAAARGLALATAVGVVDRVHRDATHGRALALPAHAAGLAPVDVGLLGVADLADSRAAPRVDVADLTRGHAQLRHAGVLCNELHARAGRPRDLRAAAR